MELNEVNVYVRNDRGKSYARKLRREKKIPGVIYGKNYEPISIYLEARDLSELMSKHKGEHSLLSIRINDKESAQFYAIIKEVQREVLTGEILHVDLHRVQMDEEIETLVPLKITGTEGLKKSEAVVQLMIEEVKIKTLPGKIPEFLSVDISTLNIGDKLKIKDIVGKVEYKILNDPEETILIIVHAFKEEEKVPVGEVKEEPQRQEVREESEGEA